MLLPFNIFYEKLINQTKLQTGRLGWERWTDWAQKAFDIDATTWEGDRGVLVMRSNDRNLEVYWRSPRVGGIPIGDGILRKAEVKRFGDLTDEDALLDGFTWSHPPNPRPPRVAFRKALRERNPKVKIKESTRLVLLTFEWMDGPHDRVCVRCYKRRKMIDNQEGGLCTMCGL